MTARRMIAPTIALALSAPCSPSQSPSEAMVLPSALQDGQAGAVAIGHRGVGCVLSEKNPVIEARLDPADRVARARLQFRAEGGPFWYYVEMKPEHEVFRGVLPRPSKATRKIDYYIEVVDRSFAESRTTEYSSAVAGSSADCPKGMLPAAALAASTVLVGALPGAPAVPLGFSSAGLTLAGGSVAGGAAGAGSGGAAGASAVAGAATGGGISTALVVAGVVVGAGAIAGVAAAKHGEERVVIEVTPAPLVRVANGGSAQFNAVAKLNSGQPLSPQPSFTWSTTCACVRVTPTGLATLDSAFGPGGCSSVIATDDKGRQGFSHIGLQGGPACPPTQ